MTKFLPGISVVAEAVDTSWNMGTPGYEDTNFYPESGQALEQAAQSACENTILGDIH